jgi:N-acetyl-anhydromuramyl-L-alanine amidase AmpD
MSYTNSTLVDCQVLSPNHSGQRTHKIKRITPHIVVGQLIAENIGYCFDDTSREASCNYGIGTDGRVCLVVPEAFRSWCSGSRDNDQQAVTIECASDKTYPYAVNDVVFKKLIDLCVDICKRNGAAKLLWISNKDTALNYEPKDDEIIITIHNWFENTECPGEYLYNKLGELAAEVTRRLGGVTKIQYTKYSKEEFIEKVAASVNAIRKEFGIEVASPIIAQACLESAYGTTNKATHNNYFGLKYRENRCPSACGTFVDGSQEQLANGQFVPITDQWFEFETLEKGIRGYFEYTNIDRYKDLKGEKDPKKYLEKIKAAGYATDLEYVNKVFNVITKWNLTRFDTKEEVKQEEKKYYRVRKSWEDAESQIGAYEVLDNAKNDCPEGYTVYDWNEKAVYSKPKKDLIAVDGEWGRDTTLKTQKVFGTMQDGEISHQLKSCKAFLINCFDSSWEFDDTGKGSALIRAIQTHLKEKGYNVGAVDGLCGKQTVIAIQQFLNDRAYNCGEVDGYMGAKTVKAWQKYINNRL